MGYSCGVCELERTGGGGGGVRVQTTFWSFEKRSWKVRPGRGEVRREQCALCPKARELPAHKGGRACCIGWTEPAGREVVVRTSLGAGSPTHASFLGGPGGSGQSYEKSFLYFGHTLHFIHCLLKTVG